MWDVTVLAIVLLPVPLISTHTSRVGCDTDWQSIRGTGYISTHTSRVGCDIVFIIHASDTSLFLLTHPVWDVTQEEGADIEVNKHFYSHIPCGM